MGVEGVSSRAGVQLPRNVQAASASAESAQRRAESVLKSRSLRFTTRSVRASTVAKHRPQTGFLELSARLSRGLRSAARSFGPGRIAGAYCCIHGVPVH
jgi:hypothetical protein